MTKAFTLIEVLVSVMILAVVGTGLLQISTNSKHNFIFLKEKSTFDRLASLALNHNSQKFHHKNMTLYDFIKDDYTKIDDELRQYLKKIKITYSHEEVSTFKPLEGSLDEQREYQDENDIATPQTALNLTIIYDKISISNTKSATYAYKVYIPTGNK